MDGINSVFTVAATVFAVVALVAVALVVFRSQYVKATVETLKESNAALVERVELAEEGETRAETRAAALAKENEALRTMVSGAEAVKELSTTMNRQYKKLMRALEYTAGSIRSQGAPPHGEPTTQQQLPPQREGQDFRGIFSVDDDN